MPIKAKHLVGAAVGLALVLSLVWISVDGWKHPELVQLIAPAGLLRVELADTAARRAAGLSHRDVVLGDGLLLQWEAPGRHPIWMAEMRFPLDVAWLAGDGHVLAVLTNVVPCAAEPCPLYAPAGTDTSVGVLELPAGGAAKYGVVTGTRVPFQNAAPPGKQY